MQMNIEPTLYTDPQAAAAKRCAKCGGAVYPPGFFCLRCERNGHDPTRAE